MTDGDRKDDRRTEDRADQGTGYAEEAAYPGTSGGDCDCPASRCSDTHRLRDVRPVVGLLRYSGVKPLPLLHARRHSFGAYPVSLPNS